MKSNALKKLLAACFISSLASCSRFPVPNLRAVTPVPPALGIGALYTETNSKKEGELSPEEFVKFLYPQVGPKGETLKGPASCFSSEDTEAIMRTLENVCVKLPCNLEEFSEVVQKIQAARASAVERVALASKKPKPAPVIRKK